MNINKSLYEYTKNNKDVFFLRKKDYKWYDRSQSKVSEEFNEILTKNTKLPQELIKKIQRINIAVAMMVSNKKLETLDRDRESILESIEEIDKYIKKNKLELDDKEFIENFHNYKACLNQYFVLSRMEYLASEIQKECLENKTDGNLYEFTKLIELYLSRDEYHDYNYAPIEIYTLAPIQHQRAEELFGELYEELKECEKIEKNLKNTNSR